MNIVTQYPTELSPRIRVLHVTGQMNHGGAEVMMMELLRNKAPSTQIDFLIHQRPIDDGQKADFDDEILSLGSQIFTIATPWSTSTLSYVRSFKKLIKQLGSIDVIHIHLNSKSGVVVLAAWLASIKKIVVHSHAALTFRGSLAYRLAAKGELFFTQLLFRQFATDFWGCSGEANKSLFPRWVLKSRKPAIINNAININKYLAVSEDSSLRLRKTLLQKGTTLLIGNVGRIVRHKKIDFLVDVLIALRDKNIHATLVIVGREDHESYVQEIRQKADNNISNNIIFLGSRADIPDLMSAFDVFAGPALKEGFGLVAAEAQAAGTPCVLSQGFPKSIDMKLNLVKYCDDYDAQVWADAIITSQESSKPNSEAILNSFEKAGFDARTNTNNIERAYRSKAEI